MTCALAVVGSRNFTDYDLMFQVVSLRMPHRIVSGGAPGADTLAESVAAELHISCQVYRAAWARHGKAAGFLRNQLLVDTATELVAFYGPNGPTPGTRDSVARARKKGIPVSEYHQEAE